MRGIVFLGNRKLELQDFPDPTPGPGEVVLQMKASGMCGSDLHPYRAAGNAAAALGLGGGRGPVVAGHEPCGVVAERGPGVSEGDAPIGQRVMVHHYKGCGRCKHCRVGWAQLCRQGIVVYGMTGHGGHALARAFGAEAVVNAREADPVAALRELTHGEGVETAMDCTGNPEARVAAVRSAATWGRVAFVGEGNTTTFDISQDMIRRQLTIHASWTFSSAGQAECARFVADRRIPLDRLLTHRFTLEQADEAYRLFDTQTTGKGFFAFA